MKVHLRKLPPDDKSPACHSKRGYVHDLDMTIDFTKVTCERCQLKIKQGKAKPWPVN